MKPQLLFYLAHGNDPHRCAVGPALAAAAARVGCAFDLYYDGRRSGRHFGGWDPGGGSEALATGSLVAGGRHLDHALWLTTIYRVAAVGDPASPLWPVVEIAGEVIAKSADPADIFAAALGWLQMPAPAEVMVLDAGPQTSLELVTAPFLYPRLLSTSCLGIDVSGSAALRERLERLGARRFVGLYADPDRSAAFPGGLDAKEGGVAGETYASLTARLARAHAGWGCGTFLGDPGLVAAMLPLAAQRRLLPIYGRPQTEAIERISDLIRKGSDPVYGRQFDDHDFFALGRLGRGLQIVDPDPPFASAAYGKKRRVRPEPAAALEPDDERLRSWAAEGRVLATLVLWAGMIRELHCIPRILDLVAATGLRCGLVVTVDSLAQANPSDFSLLSVPEERGGMLGQVELLLGSTGRGVCAEGCMPKGELARLVSSARREIAGLVPDHLVPRGWWPLIDAELVDARRPRVRWDGWRPGVLIPPRPRAVEHAAAATLALEDGRGTAKGLDDTRHAIGRLLRRYRLDRFYEAWRPYDHARPGDLDPSIVDAIRSAGFEYMWTKTGFGSPQAAHVDGDFVALPFTAGDWDGWSPFYTVGSRRQVHRAERRLLAAQNPGWFASNIDAILWMLPGEVLEKGHTLFDMAKLIAAGGRSGRLVNVTPHVVARYARILSGRAPVADAPQSVPAGANAKMPPRLAAASRRAEN